MSGSKAGAINEEGGTFGKLEVAREAEYFYKKVRLLLNIFDDIWSNDSRFKISFKFQQLEQLATLKKKDASAEDMLKSQIKEHEQAINQAKENLAKLKK